MEAKVVQIGNSKGIRIPNHILKSLKITEAVDMVVDETKNEIILEAVRKPRENWDSAFKKMHTAKDDTLGIDASISLDAEQWEW